MKTNHQKQKGLSVLKLTKSIQQPATFKKRNVGFYGGKLPAALGVN